MIKRFFMCGLTGWCLEILWTSFSSFRRKNFKLTGTTSLWMFPIYGTACLLLPLSRILCSFSTGIRGIMYASVIMTAEFLSGTLLSLKNFCPWDYSNARFHYRGLVRADYFFLWFFVGLFYEKLLTVTQKKNRLNDSVSSNRPQSLTINHS